MDVSINLAAVLVAAIAHMIIGAIWYSPVFFARPWMHLVRKTEEDLKNNSDGGMYLTTFIGAVLLSYILAHFLYLTGAETIGEGLKLGFWAWLGFTAITTLNNYTFEGRSKKLWAINIGYPLLGILVMSAILVSWN